MRFFGDLYRRDGRIQRCADCGHSWCYSVVLGAHLYSFTGYQGQLRKAAEKNAATQSLLVEALSGVQTIKAQNAENTVRWRWQRSYSSFMSESFRTLLISISTGTAGQFLKSTHWSSYSLGRCFSW